tara:strand:+ start:55 stop:483 length:429 start_codon:yes stop_codon:yes gene_type:complete
LKIIITNLEKKHLPNVYDLLYSNVSKFKPSKNRYNSIWKILLKQKNNYFIVAKNNKDIVGFGSLGIINKVRGDVQGTIEDIVIKKKFQKKGIGRLIIYKLLAIAKKQNCYKVVLQSPNKNLSFYRKMGFKIRHKSMQYLFIS